MSERLPSPEHLQQVMLPASGYLGGLKKAIPIIIGYCTVAMAFGLLARTRGLSNMESGGMSLIVFAGASQFIALNLLSGGTAFFEIIIATFFLNLRHLLMSASLSLHFKSFPLPAKIFLAFGITDETFAIASTDLNSITPASMAGLETGAYLSWFGGTMAGYYLGTALPPSLQAAMALALYALFTALLLPQIKHSLKLAALALSAAVLNSILVVAIGLPVGWSFVLAMLATSLAGAFAGLAAEKEHNDES
jgi:4-azaleucine resistance transporter AzlC